MSEWISETDLAASLNVPRDILKKRRPYLPPGGVRANGKVVEWSKDCAEAAAAELGLGADNCKKTAPVAVQEAEAPKAETLVVVSKPMIGGWHFRNPRIIRAQRENREVVDVRVTDSRKYAPTTLDGKPMTFRAVKSTSGQWWQLVGREPRWARRW